MRTCVRFSSIVICIISRVIPSGQDFFFYQFLVVHSNFSIRQQWNVIFQRVSPCHWDVIFLEKHVSVTFFCFSGHLFLSHTSQFLHDYTIAFPPYIFVPLYTVFSIASFLLCLLMLLSLLDPLVAYMHPHMQCVPSKITYSPKALKNWKSLRSVHYYFKGGHFHQIHQHRVLKPASQHTLQNFQMRLP